MLNSTSTFFHLFNFIFLKKNQTLRYLNLNGNKIGNKGGMCMAQMLQVNFFVQHLDLGDSDLVLLS